MNEACCCWSWSWNCRYPRLVFPLQFRFPTLPRLNCNLDSELGVLVRRNAFWSYGILWQSSHIDCRWEPDSEHMAYALRLTSHCVISVPREMRSQRFELFSNIFKRLYFISLKINGVICSLFYCCLYIFFSSFF